MTSDDFDLDIDPMLFMQLVVDDHLELIDSITSAGAAFGPVPGMGSLADGVAEVGREKLAEAQAHLDMLVATDPTWKPAYGTECEMVYDGTDPEDGNYYRCTVHGYLVLGDGMYVCEGYQAPPYTGGH